MDSLTIWCCPSCRGRLTSDPVDRLVCTACAAGYDVVAGIPDLRIDAPAWIDLAEDREAALRLVHDTRSQTLAAMVRSVFSSQPGRTPADIDLRTRQVLGSPARLKPELEGWLRDAARTPGVVDLGCGPGMLLAAAAAHGVSGVGIDVSLVWLAVARRMIEEHGGRATLAAAFGESLPLPDGRTPALVSLDVIEHVGDQERYLREIDRVTAPNASIAISTPNRFSLAAEPHVGVWGVGWLPLNLQKRYVKARTGHDYDYVRLLSVPGMAAMVKRTMHVSPRFIVPRIPEEEIAHFPPRRVALAHAYNRVAASPLMRWPLLAVGPFFRFVATKSASTGTPA